MDSMNPEMTIAEGPDGLMNVLDGFRHQAAHAEPHYILYRLNSQESLIKIDFSKEPYQFWYYDLLGRPATNAVKNTIANFLSEKCGIDVRDRFEEYFHDKVNRQALLELTLGINTIVKPQDPLAHARKELQACQRIAVTQTPSANLQQQFASMPRTSSIGIFGIENQEKTSQPEDTPTPKKR